MKTFRTTRAALLLATVLATSACSAPAAESRASSPTERPAGVASASAPDTAPTSATGEDEITFTAADLCGLLLTRDDVSTEFSVEIEAEEAEDLCINGFRADDENPLPSVISGAYRFADASEAQREAAAFSEVAAEGAEQFEADLGDASYCYLVEYEETTSAITYGDVTCYWAIGNAVLFVTYNSDEPVDEADALEYAEIMQTRAENR